MNTEATRLRELLQAEHMRQPDGIEQAMGLQLHGLVGQLDAVCILLIDLEEQIDRAFAAHPDVPILSSFPGLGVALGARLLAEIGDDHDRFADARALKAFAGAAPVTRASGRSRFVHARRAKNDRIAATGYVWALAAIRLPTTPSGTPATASGARLVIGTSPPYPLFNCMLGKLHHCLTTGQPYNPDEAFRAGACRADRPATV